MILSASRRTDIPAFYAEWFCNRLRDGFVVTRNPFNANQLSKIKLDSSIVDAIVFWTKNAKPMLSHLDELDSSGIAYYFQFTITPYGKDLEPHLPTDKSSLIEAFKSLSAYLGPDRVIWRYDPILFNDKYTADFHEKAFERCASLLRGSTNRAVISFLDMDYNNTKAIKKTGIRDGSVEEKNELAAFIAKSAAKFGMEVETCAEDIDLETCGIKHGHCIDADLIERMTGKSLSSKGKQRDKTQRLLCGCVASTDIGAYNTCLHGCAYCYANYSQGAIRGNCQKHDSTSAVLIGECNPDEVPFRKGQRSFFERLPPQQDSLF